jgi:hypothetical protein
MRPTTTALQPDFGQFTASGRLSERVGEGALCTGRETYEFAEQTAECRGGVQRRPTAIPLYLAQSHSPVLGFQRSLRSI